MVLYELKSLIAPRWARIFDGAVLIIVTLAALFYCDGVQVFPDDFSPTRWRQTSCCLSQISSLAGFSYARCAGSSSSSGESAVSPLNSHQARAGSPSRHFCSINQMQNVMSEPMRISGPILRRSEYSRSPAVLEPPSSRSHRRLQADRRRVRQSRRLLTRLQARASTCLSFPERMLTRGFCEKASKLGANVEVGFSVPVVQRALVRRYGPRA